MKKKQNTPAKSSSQKKSSGKIDTRFLENVVGGKGDNAKHVEKNDDEQLLANVDIGDEQGGSGDAVLNADGVKVRPGDALIAIGRHVLHVTGVVMGHPLRSSP